MSRDNQQHCNSAPTTKKIADEKLSRASFDASIPSLSDDNDVFKIEKLTMAYGDYVVMRDLNFTIKKGEIFFIIGGSGCGKSTLLRHMIGLVKPAAGKIFYRGEDFGAATEERRLEILRQFGILYQGGALWSSMTLSENVILPIMEFSDISEKVAENLAQLKLALVGLNGFGAFYPSEISGGMAKRAGLARAIALDPLVLFFDEPSAGLDPISSHRLDQLIRQMRDSLGATVVIVSHELASIFDIADRVVFLDAKTKTQGAIGSPRELLAHGDKDVRVFLNRGVDPLEKKDIYEK